MNKATLIAISKKSALLAMIVGSVLLTGCARQISPDTYSASSIGEVSKTYNGVIVHARLVMVQDQERLQDNGLGIIGGAIAGGVVGNQFGHGSGNTLATVGGALAGATAGAFAEKKLKEQNGMEYVVQLENGESRTVVQGPQPQLHVGQSVLLMESHQGRSRIVAR